MSPEQALGRPADTRSDVYSLGALLYFLLTDHWPHDMEGDLTALLWRVAHEPHCPPTRHVPTPDGGLAAILSCALAVDPADRY